MAMHVIGAGVGRTGTYSLKLAITSASSSTSRKSPNRFLARIAAQNSGTGSPARIDAGTCIVTIVRPMYATIEVSQSMV